MSERNFARAVENTEFLKFLVIDVLGAVIFGVVAWVITRDTVSSFIVSLATATIIMIVELRFQLVAAKEDLGVAVGLQRESMKDNFLLTTMPRIISGYSDVARSGDQFFLDRAREAINNCAAEVTRLEEGHLEAAAKDVYGHVKRNFAESKYSVFGTVFVALSDFWFSGGGKEYLQENFSAIKRGVKVTRVFILDDLKDITPEAERLIKAQADGGIVVRIALAHNLTPDLLHDMGIYDDKYAVYVDHIPGSKKLRGARFYRDDAALRQARNIRDRILRESEDALVILERRSEPGKGPTG